MTAIIMAGGDGLRLRPLTCSIPKAMLKVANIPLIDYTLDALERQNFTECIITVDRMSDQIIDYLDDGDSVKFSTFDTPAGTARSLSNAALKVSTDYVVVINADTIFDFDLDSLIKHHEYKKSDITLIVKKTDNPSNYIIAVSESGVVTDINEDLPRESCISNLACTGIMVINTELASKLHEYGEDIYIDCIPNVIKNSVKVNTITESGFWIDINTPEDYFAANNAVLHGEYKYTESMTDPKDFPNIKITMPVCIAKNADIADGVEIFEGSIIDENCTISKGAKIHGGIIMNGAYIGERATVNQAIIGEGVKLLSSSAVYEGAIIGSNAVIGENSIVNKAVRIWNSRNIEAYACAANDIKYGFAKPLVIDDEGITGETNGIITPQIASIIGSSMASIGDTHSNGRKVGIGYNNTSASQALAYAIASGIMSSGGDVWMFGETTEPELAFCVKTCELSSGCYVDALVTAKLKFVSADGLPLTRLEEKIIEAGINRNEYRRVGFTHFGIMKNCPEINELYKTFLVKLSPKKLNGIRAIVNTSSKKLDGLCEEILKDINDKNGNPIVFHISSDGRKISAYTDETGYVFHEKLMLLCCQREFQKGEDVSLPYDFPTVADKLADRYGSVVVRYSGCASSHNDLAEMKAREIASKKPFVYDSVALMLIILESLSSSNLTLKQAIEELPDFATSNRFVALSTNSHDKRDSIEVLRNICADRQAVNDGIIINDNRGRVLIRPVKTGKGVMMHVESYAVEAAGELCDFYQDLLTKKFREYTS